MDGANNNEEAKPPKSQPPKKIWEPLTVKTAKKRQEPISELVMAAREVTTLTLRKVDLNQPKVSFEAASAALSGGINLNPNPEMVVNQRSRKDRKESWSTYMAKKQKWTTWEESSKSKQQPWRLSMTCWKKMPFLSLTHIRRSENSHQELNLLWKNVLTLYW